MGIQNILQLFFLITAVTHVQQTTAIICYECDDDPVSTIYVPDCGKLHYNNASNTVESDNPDYLCEITLWDNGYVTRGLYEGDVHQENGDCITGAVMKKCFCEGDLCNTDSFCNQCGDIITTSSTDEPTEPSTKPTTKPTTAPTTKPTTSKPTPPPPGTLTCYICDDCKTIDDDTPTIADEIFEMCMTTYEIENTKVIRGGAVNEHPDGMCVEDELSIVCWCGTNLCNDTPY